MKIDVLWTPSKLEQMPVLDRTGVVVDVLRSGTTVATAIRNGARAVVPAASTEEAIRIANSIGRDQVLLCGEQGGARIGGFDLGNSPAEFSVDVVVDYTLVMVTPNGTRTLLSLVSSPTVFIAAFINLSAVAAQLVTARDPLIVCAGREGTVSVDDALCAGHLLEVCLKKRKGNSAEIVLGDGAIAALALARQNGPVDAQFLRNTAAGRALQEIGHGRDIEDCANLDALREVPVFRGRQITRLEPSSRSGSRTSQA